VRSIGVNRYSCLARSAKLLTGPHILLALISFLSILMISWRQIISGSAGLIFAIFLHMKAFWVQMIDGPLFPISQGTLPWQPIL